MAPLPESRALFEALEHPLTAVLVSATESSETPIFPAELGCLSRNASPKRRHQFLLGRYAARLALRQSESEFDSEIPLLRNNEGIPIWPYGIIGSLSHTANLACAAVADQRDLRSVGIDVETVRLPRQENLPERIFVPEDNQWIFEDSDLAPFRFAVLFSSCESILKCVAPLTDQRPRFKDVRFEQGAENRMHVIWLENRTELPDTHLPTTVFVEDHGDAVVTLTTIPTEE